MKSPALDTSYLRVSLLLLLLTMGTACSEEPEGGGPLEVLEVSVELTPSAPTTTDALFAVATPSVADAELSFSWWRDGVETDHDQPRLEDTFTARGETWRAVVTATSASSTASAEATTVIGNAAPEMTSVVVASTGTLDAPRFACLATASDPDDDEVSLTYGWFADGEEISGADGDTLSGSDAELPAGTRVTCTATASDGEASTGPTTSANTAIVGEASRVVASVSLTPATLHMCSLPSCSFELTDGPGAEPQTEFFWTLNDSLLPEAHGDTLDTVQLTAGDAVACGVRWRAAAGDPWIDTASPAITVTNVAPQATDASLPELALVGDVLTCTASGYVDEDCDSAPRYEYQWWVDDAPAAGTASTFDTAALSPGQSVSCEATPTDGTDQGSPLRSNPSVLLAGEVELVGELSGSRAGFSVAIGPDLNGDGIMDLLLGAPTATPTPGQTGAGRVYVVYGTETGEVDLADVASGAAGFVLDGEIGGLAPNRYLCAGYNGAEPCGGLADIAYLGDDAAKLKGPAGDAFGFRVVPVGDHDLDGVPDIIVSAPYTYQFNGTPNPFAGSLYQVSGADLGTGPLVALRHREPLGARALVGSRPTTRDLGSLGGGLLGFSAINCGDFNGDGQDDYAACQPNASMLSACVVDYGVAEPSRFVDGLLWSAVYRSTGMYLESYYPSSKGFGVDLGRAGDFDGDGFDDLLLQTADSGNDGAFLVFGGYDSYLLRPGEFDPGLAPGELAPTLTIHNGLREVTDDALTAGRDMFGWAVGGGGDVNGDGLSDVVVTAAGPNANAMAYVIFGEPTRADVYLDDIAAGTGGFEISGDFETRAPLGDVTIGGDLNGDGLDDIVISSSTGHVDVIFGKTDTAPVSLTDIAAGTGGFRYTVAGGAARGFGVSVDVGDVNGDGLADLLVGADRSDGPSFNGLPQPDVGGAFLRFGRDEAGTVDFRGGSGDDALTGTVAPEVFVSGWGDDTLEGGGGEDVFYAGAGDDRVVVGDDSYRRVDGGPGFDTLRWVTPPDPLSLAELRTRVRNIEAIDIDDALSQTLTVEAQDVGKSRITTIIGDAADTVQALDTKWDYVDTVTIGGRNFARFTAGSAELQVATAVRTDFGPVASPANATLSEWVTSGTSVVTVEAADPDGGALTFAITAESDPDGVFSIDASTGEITVADATTISFDGTRRYDLTVEITDGDGRTTTASVQVFIRNEPGPPAFISEPAVYSIEEGVANGTVVGAVFATDPEGDSVAFSMASGDYAPFAINPRGVIHVSNASLLDHTQSPLVFTVEARDGDNEVAYKEVTVHVGDPMVMESSATALYRILDAPVFESPVPTLQFYDETFTVSPNEAPRSRVTPIPGGQLELRDSDFEGIFRVSQTTSTGSATFDAFLPIDFNFSFPSAVTLGQSYEWLASWALRSDAHFITEIPEVVDRRYIQRLGSVKSGVELCAYAACDFYSQSYGWGGQEEVLVSVTPGRKFRVGSGLRANFVEHRHKGYEVSDWQAFTDGVLQDIGKTSATEAVDIPDPSGAGSGVHVDYEHFRIAFSHDRYTRVRPRLHLWRVIGVMRFLESGDSFEFELDRAGENRTIPAGADANNDGVIEFELQLRLEGFYNHDYYFFGDGRVHYQSGIATVSSLAAPGDPDHFETFSTAPAVNYTRAGGGKVNLAHSYILNFNLHVVRGSFQVN